MRRSCPEGRLQLNDVGYVTAFTVASRIRGEPGNAAAPRARPWSSRPSRRDIRVAKHLWRTDWHTRRRGPWASDATCTSWANLETCRRKRDRVLSALHFGGGSIDEVTRFLRPFFAPPPLVRGYTASAGACPLSTHRVEYSLGAFAPAPGTVRGPVLLPPCIRHRPFGIACDLQGAAPGPRATSRAGLCQWHRDSRVRQAMRGLSLGLSLGSGRPPPPLVNTPIRAAGGKDRRGDRRRAVAPVSLSRLQPPQRYPDRTRQRKQNRQSLLQATPGCASRVRLSERKEAPWLAMRRAVSPWVHPLRAVVLLISS